MPPRKRTRSEQKKAADADDHEAKAGEQNGSGDQGDLYHDDGALKHPNPKRAKEIDEQPPLQELDELLKSQEETDKTSSKKNVLHWFRSKDVRQEDNRSLAAASRQARENGGALLTVFLFSPEDLIWHGTSPARCDFMLESLRIVQQQLESEDKNIPLTLLTAEHRSDKTDRILEFVKKHDISHIHANYEYEVDELRRDIDLLKKIREDDLGVTLKLHHDQTIMVPGELKGGGGKPHKVFTPYYRAWLGQVEKHPEYLDEAETPLSNDKSVRDTHKDLFGSPLPEPPKTKRFASNEEQARIRKLWPAGNEAALSRLEDFLKNKANGIALRHTHYTWGPQSKQVKMYKTDRSTPALDPSSRLSAYFSSGVISIRQALNRAKEHNGNQDSFQASNGDEGIAKWVRELVFREFYRHTMVITPHTSMNLPGHLKFEFVEWEDDEEGWKKWCEGRTGVPFVDAGMRQLNHEAYMHNRLRMNVSSYLTANLLLDYRLGERYFAEHLVDWDLANNTNGWEPSFTIFNAVIQAKKCDPQGEYIKKWVPELKDLTGDAVFAPHLHLSEDEFDKLGYPRPHVEYEESRDRAKARFKEGMARAQI